MWTKPRAEKAAAHLIEARDIPVWLPTMNVRRRWSDRWKHIDVPVFPGYLFAQSNVKTWSVLLRVPGVLTVVKHAGKPAWIRPQHLDELRVAVERVAAGVPEPEVLEHFEPGDRVRVIEGPLAGLIGVVREIRGSRRLLVGFEQISRALSISIGAAAVERYYDE